MTQYNWDFVIAAFGISWAVIIGYVWRLAVRERRARTTQQHTRAGEL